MRTLPLALLCAVALSPVAKADKYWLEPPDTKRSAEGSLPATIDGVLLDEDATTYHLRTVGGEIWLPKKSVHRIDKDALTVAEIEKAERDQAVQLAAADQDRQRAQAAEASARREMARPVEAALPPGGAAAQPEPVVTPVYYDPAIRALLPVGPVTDAELMMQLDMAYDQTRDRTYLKLLRQARRVR